MSTISTDRSLSDIVRELTQDLSALVRSEVALARTELQHSISRLGTGAGLLGGAGVIGLFALEFVLLTLMFGIVALGLSLWLAALIVAVFLGFVAGVLAMSGRKSVQGASLTPTHTIEQVKTDISTIKADVARVRSRA